MLYFDILTLPSEVPKVLMAFVQPLTILHHCVWKENRVGAFPSVLCD